MDLLQSLAGRAAGAVERVTASLGTKAPAAREGAEAGPAADFAAMLALAMNPAAPPAPSTPAALAGAPGAAPAGVAAVEGAEGEAEGADGTDGTDGAAGTGAELAAGAVAAAPDPEQVQRSLALLDPEMQRRLGRVIERMQSEYGHTVRVAETARTQERQDFLYEQGRTRPGQVVTWTRDSNHLTGRAADVIVDGSYDNPVGYQRLARIAAEEGLRTLGPRDAGHVELPRGAPGTPGFDPALRLEGVLAQGETATTARKWEPAMEVPGRSGGMARVAEVARVADVARVAEVAEVARVARVAVPGMAAPSRATEAVQVLHQAMGSHQGLSALRSELASFAGDRGSGAGEGETPGFLESELLRGESVPMPRGAFQGAVGEVLAAGGAGAAERAARVMELQDGAASGPVNHVLLRVDNPGGGEDRIRVDLRGTTVDATIDMRNAGEAERVAGRLGDLQRSLERHGLEAETLRVRATANTTETVDLPRAGIALAEAESSRGARSGSGGSDPESFREGWKDESQRESRRDPSDPRQRPRRPTPEKENA